MAEINLEKVLEIAVKEKASDVHLKTGLPPILRVFGKLVPLKNADRIGSEDLRKLSLGLMNEMQKDLFKIDHQVDMGHGIAGLGRFRLNIYRQRGSINVAIRIIPVIIHSFNELHLPEVLEKISEELRGLILVTGITGCGKTTTQASMIDHINMHRTSHIITIEDPIEYLHKDKKSIISQREIGIDAVSFTDALRSSLRQDPDVMLVGEMRDLETVEIALSAAETGHLVLSTLHTIDATEAINRIISSFPAHQHQQVRNQLAAVLKAIISQRLIPKKDGSGMVPAAEILVSTARMRECILDKDRVKEIPEVISTGHTTYGMQSFDQSLLGHLTAGLISHEEALRQASNPSDFELKTKGVTSESDVKWKDFETGEEEEEKDEGFMERFDRG
jgi:twitching motility protein PilT